MVYLPVVFFGLAACGGIILFVMKRKGTGMPFPLAIGHGLLAVTGLVILWYIVLNTAVTMLMSLSAWIFLAAAAGGLTVFSFHIRKKRIPDALIIVHALAAVASYILLVISVFI